MISQFLSMISQANLYHVTQTMLKIWSCDPKLVTLAFLRENFYRFNKKKCRGVLGSTPIIWDYHQVQACNFTPAKGLKVKVRKFQGLIPMFVKVTIYKNWQGGFCALPHPHLGYCYNDKRKSLLICLKNNIYLGKSFNNIISEMTTRVTGKGSSQHFSSYI